MENVEVHPRDLLSVVVPVWNRQDIIPRCLASILQQEADFGEIVVVDDASTDRTIEVVECLEDPRVRVVPHAQNAGVTAARATGTEEARGRWILYVDSDWELLPGTVAKLQARIEQADADVGLLGFSCKQDNGTVTPSPKYPDGVIELSDYMKYENARCRAPGPRDFLYCIRRDKALEVGWPKDRCFETVFLLQLAAVCKWEVSAELGAHIHFDAPNRYSTEDIPSIRTVETATANADGLQRVLEKFSTPLRESAPLWRSALHRMCGSWSFRANRRCRGARHTLKSFLLRPRLSTVVLLGVGLVHPKGLQRKRRKQK